MFVRDETVSVKICLTSPLLRESPEEAAANGNATGDAALLAREPCLKVSSLYIYTHTSTTNLEHMLLHDITRSHCICSTCVFITYSNKGDLGIILLCRCW